MRRKTLYMVEKLEKLCHRILEFGQSCFKKGSDTVDSISKGNNSKAESAENMKSGVLSLTCLYAPKGLATDLG